MVAVIDRKIELICIHSSMAKAFEDARHDLPHGVELFKAPRNQLKTLTTKTPDAPQNSAAPDPDQFIIVKMPPGALYADVDNFLDGLYATFKRSNEVRLMLPDEIKAHALLQSWSEQITPQQLENANLRPL